jgi:hypothetical protein
MTKAGKNDLPQFSWLFAKEAAGVFLLMEDWRALSWL